MVHLETQNKFSVYGVLHHAVDTVWKEAAPIIEKALDRADDKYSLEDIRKFILEKKMSLWVCFENHIMTACVLTQIVCYPQSKRLLIFSMSGVGIENWLKFEHLMKEYAIRENCSYVEVYGRPGWEKMLKNYGYDKIHTVLRAKL